MVRMTGTASAGQEPTWIVFGTANFAVLFSRPKALQMARASFGQLSWSGVMSFAVSCRCGQTGGARWQWPAKSAWINGSVDGGLVGEAGLGRMRYAQLVLSGQGKDWTGFGPGWRHRILNCSKSSCIPLRQTNGTAVR